MKSASPNLSESWQGSWPNDCKFLAAAGAVVIVALLLRIYRLGAQEFWYDEALSFHMATMPNWFGAPLIDNNTPPLYYLLLRGWMTFAGQGEASLRSLSAVFGTLYVAVAIWAGREIFDSRAGLWSGVMAAAAPIHIYYSQEARAYALLMCALLATYATLWRACRTNLWRWWALFAACAMLSLYSHYFAILGLIPTALLLLLWPEKQRWARYSAAALVSGLLFLPWFLWSFVFTSHPWISIDWIPDSWERTPPLLAVPKSLEVFGLGSQAGLLPILLKQFSRLEFPLFLRLYGLVILLLLGFWVAIPWGDTGLGLPWLGKRKAFLATLLFFPLVALWLISLRKPLYLVGRYDLVAYPAYSLLLGLGLTKFQSVSKVGSWLALCVALALFMPIGTKLVLYYRIPSERISQSAVNLLDASVRDGDVVVFTGSRGLLLMYYMNRLGYRWQNGSCSNEVAGRRFSCRFMRERLEDRLTGTSASNRSRRQGFGEEIKVEEYVRTLLPQEGALWVVFDGHAILSRRGLIVSPPERQLVRELERLGLKPAPITSDLGIVQFRRS